MHEVSQRQDTSSASDPQVRFLTQGCHQDNIPLEKYQPTLIHNLLKYGWSRMYAIWKSFEFKQPNVHVNSKKLAGIFRDWNLVVCLTHIQHTEHC